MPNFFDNLWTPESVAHGDSISPDELMAPAEDLSDLASSLEKIESQTTLFEDTKELRLHHYFSLRVPADISPTAADTNLARSVHATFRPEYNFYLRQYEQAITSTLVNIEPLLPNLYVFGFYEAAKKM